MTLYEQWVTVERLRLDAIDILDGIPPEDSEPYALWFRELTKEARRLMNLIRPKSRAKVIYHLTR